MATIVTRAGKGSPLTNTEVDSNFSNLNTDKLEDITGESIKDLSDVYSTMLPTDGQLLTWDNTNSRWDAADAPVSLPDQSGHSGEYLTTDGSTASWAAIALADKSADGGFANSVYTAAQSIDGGSASG